MLWLHTRTNTHENPVNLLVGLFDSHVAFMFCYNINVKLYPFYPHLPKDLLF